jgi:hypothetical protein
MTIIFKVVPFTTPSEMPGTEFAIPMQTYRVLPIYLTVIIFVAVNVERLAAPGCRTPRQGE